MSVVAERLAVMPVGKVPKAKVTAELNPFWVVMLTLVLKVAPAVNASDVTSVLSVKPGRPITVNKRLALLVTVPPAALIVKLYCPGVAVLKAAKVSVLVPLPGAASVGALNTPLTPVGSPVTVNATGPLKPLTRLLIV